MDFAFTEEQQMISDTAAALLEQASNSAAVRAAMVTDLGYDPELWQRISNEMVWPALHIPEAFGGMGLGYVELAATLEQMGRFLLCSPFYSTVCLGANVLLVAANDIQKARYLPQIAGGGMTASLAFMTAGRVWHAGAIEVIAERDGDCFVLNGSYRYVPDGHSAQLLVLAVRRPGSSGKDGISLLLLQPNDSSTDGFSRHYLPTMDQTRKQAQLEFKHVRLPVAGSLMGEEGEAWAQLTGTSEFNEVFFDNAQCGADDIVGEPGDGWKVAMGLLGFERGVSTLGQQMLFQNELNQIIEIARANGSSRDPLIRQRIADAHIGLKLMRYNCLRMLSGSHDGSLRKEALIYKLHWSSWHRSLGELAMDVLGPEGEILDGSPYHLSRLQSMYLFVRADTIYGGTNQIQRNIIAERGLGMPREPKFSA